MTHHVASTRGDLLRMPRAGFVIEKPFKPNEIPARGAPGAGQRAGVIAIPLSP